MNKQPSSRHCFLCGTQNPAGLKLSFYDDDEGRVLAHFTPHAEHQGYPGVMHGGIACALLDETIGRVLVRRGVWAVTVELSTRFLHPVPLDKPLTVVGELVRLRSRTMEGKGRIVLEGGEVAVTATAKYMLLTEAQLAQYRDELGFWQVVPDGGDDAAVME